MLIMNQTNTLIADCIEIYIDSNEEGIWVMGLLPNSQDVHLGKYESIEAAQKVLNGFICKHA